MQLTSLKEYFDNIYSDELNILTIPVIDLEKDQEYEKPLFSCMGRDILLKDRPIYQDAIKWFMRLVSEDFYKCQLGHCDSGCLCKRSRSGENAYWRFFDIAEHPRYSQLETEIRRELFYKQNSILLEGNGYDQLAEFSRDEKNKAALKELNDRISEYLVDQLVVDYAHEETDGYQKERFNLSKDEFDLLITIATRRHERKQPLTKELESFLVYNVGAARRQHGGNLKNNKDKSTQKRTMQPRIGDGLIDYRIIFMLKKEAEAEGLDYRNLKNKKVSDFSNVIDKVCNEINGWGYFKDVKPTETGKENKGCGISKVRERYFAKHPT